jgi:hypothetical protein
MGVPSLRSLNLLVIPVAVFVMTTFARTAVTSTCPQFVSLEQALAGSECASSRGGRLDRGLVSCAWFDWACYVT